MLPRELIAASHCASLHRPDCLPFRRISLKGKAICSEVSAVPFTIVGGGRAVDSPVFANYCHVDISSTTARTTAMTTPTTAATTTTPAIANLLSLGAENVVSLLSLGGLLLFGQGLPLVLSKSGLSRM